MSIDSKGMSRYCTLQGSLFTAWESLKEHTQGAVQEYNERRAAALASLEAEAALLKSLLEEGARLQSLVEHKKLNLEAAFLHRELPYPQVTQTPEELLSASSDLLASITTVPGVTVPEEKEVVPPLE